MKKLTISMSLSKLNEIASANLFRYPKRINIIFLNTVLLFLFSNLKAP